MTEDIRPTLVAPPGQLRGGAGYPPEWPAVSLAVKAAAGWRCERCGHPDDPALRAFLGSAPGRLPCDAQCTHPSDGKQRMLTVHHLVPDKRLLAAFNLAPLCQACHLSVQSRVVFLRPWIVPHTPWMAAHVRAYNAWRSEHPEWPELPLVEETA